MIEISEHKDSSYLRVKVLKEGGFGRAYLAEDLVNRDYCVIKETKTQMMKKSEIEDIKKEAEILKVLVHPNIIRFRDIYMSKKNKLCIVMDYADGGDLYNKIENAKSYFDEETIIDMFTQICLAIKHIHDRKIVHRDLKSQNVFLNGMNMIKLGDFGISKILNHTHDMLTSFVGTWYYISPEILKGQHYSFKTDIWSLGVILYEMCCLKLPFRGQNQFVLQRKIIECKYSPIPVRYSDDLRNLVEEILVVNSAQRPSIYQILAKPIIKKRITNFLNRKDFEEEFSHTILHNQNVMNPKPVLSGMTGSRLYPVPHGVGGPAQGNAKNYSSNQVLPNYGGPNQAVLNHFRKEASEVNLAQKILLNNEDIQLKVIGRKIDQVKKIGVSSSAQRLEGLRNRPNSRFINESPMNHLGNYALAGNKLGFGQEPKNDLGLRHNLNREQPVRSPAIPDRNYYNPQPVISKPAGNNFFSRIDDLYEKLSDVRKLDEPSAARNFDLEERLKEVDQMHRMKHAKESYVKDDVLINKYRLDFNDILQQYREAIDIKPQDYKDEDIEIVEKRFVEKDKVSQIDELEDIEEYSIGDKVIKDKEMSYSDFIRHIINDVHGETGLDADVLRNQLENAVSGENFLELQDVFDKNDSKGLDPAVLLMVACTDPQVML